MLSLVVLLMISFFIGNSELGLYKIANSLTQPLSMLPKNYSLLKFKQFAKSKFVNKKEFHNLLMIILIVFLIGVVLIYVIMNYFYAKEFFDALYIAYILLFAVIMNSIYQMHNMFMNANSMGKIIKNNSLKMMLVNIIMNFTLIPFLGAIGASIASVMSIYTYMYFTFKEYKKFINGEKNSVK
jgi:O-antigen/teichoic acid export membrane protein